MPKLIVRASVSHKLPSSSSCFSPSRNAFCPRHTNLHGGTILQACDTKASCSSSHSCWLYLCSAAASARHSLHTPSLKHQVLVLCWYEDERSRLHSSGFTATTPGFLQSSLWLKHICKQCFFWSSLLTVDCVKSWKDQFIQGDKWWAAFVCSLGTAGEGWDNTRGFELVVSVCSSQKVDFTSHLGDWHLRASSPCATAPGNKRSLWSSKDVPDSLKGISHDRNGSNTNTMNASYTILPHYKGKKPFKVSCKSILGIHFSCFSPQ